MFRRIGEYISLELFYFVNLTHSFEHWNCFKGNVGETAERRGEPVWAFPNAHTPS